MQFFNYIHRLISGIDKELGLTLWAIQQVPYQNRIVADFCSRLFPTNWTTNKFLVFKHVFLFLAYI